jgi:mannose PTS system EIID component
MPRFARVLARCFAIQAAWNYETMMGAGFGWAAEPALRDLPGGPAGDAYRQAVARESDFFNAHPYFAPLAVGAAAKAELAGEDPAKIAKLRAALCGPLGSIGDRLFWAAWLPACAAIALALVAFGLYGWAVIAFLALYNGAHVGCRWWALRAGWRQGLHVGAALGAPALLRAGDLAAPVAAVAVGLMLPLVLEWQLTGMAAQLNYQGLGAPPRIILAGVLGAVGVAGLIRLIAPRATGAAVAGTVLVLAWLVGRLWP